MYYQVFRGDGSSKNYKVLSEMLEDFDRQDVEELYRLVKERYSASRPEGYDLMLWGDLHTLFEPDEEDELWKNQHEYNVISWSLYDFCGIHILLMQNGIAIHMLTEKKYPLSQEMISKMLKKKLEVDHESSQAFELLRRGINILNTRDRVTSTFDGICHQTFRAAKTSVNTKESDSDNEEEYSIKMNSFGASIYRPKSSKYLNYNDPIDRALALQEVLNPFWKVCVWKKAVGFLGSFPVTLQHLDWKPIYSGNFCRKEDGEGQWHAKIRLTDPYGNIYDQGLHTAEEMAEDGFGAYWLGSKRLIPDKGVLAPEKVTATDLFYLRSMDRGAANVPYLLAQYLFRHAEGRKSSARLPGYLELPLIDMGELVKLNIGMEIGDDWAWVAPGPERQQVVAAGDLGVAEDAPTVDEGDQVVLVPVQAPQQPPPPPPVAGRTMPQRLGRLEEEVQGSWRLAGRHFRHSMGPSGVAHLQHFREAPGRGLARPAPP
ncbi:hypothetical protein Tco_0982514 [Tanacetum coccineum]